jgi:rubrerythrin
MGKIFLDNRAYVLEMIAQGEAGVGNFYRACAARWPEDREFWLGLAAEKEEHYRMVQRMYMLVKAYPERYTLRSQFGSSAYRSFISWVLTMATGVSNGMLTCPEAIDISHTIELTILESKVDELIATAEPEYLNMIGRISEQTRKHAALAEARAKGLARQLASAA